MFAVSPFRRGRYLLVGIILVTYFIFRQAPRSWTIPRGSIPTSHGQFLETSPLELPHLLHTEVAIPKTKLRVAVLEHAGFHDEVIGPVLKTLEDIGADYTVYRNEWRWGFEKVLQDFLIPMPRRKDRTALATDAETNAFDVVIHVSCDNNFRTIGRNDHIFETLDDTEDLHYICIQHELEMLQPKDWTTWTPAVQQGRFRFMTLSSHTSRALHDATQKAALRRKDVSWADVKVDTLVPVFPFYPPELPAKADPKLAVTPIGAKGRLPAKIAILGRVMPERRSYQAIIDDFHKAILADPAAWGYLPPTSETAPYVSADDPDRPAVTFHFVGSQPKTTHLNIPVSMKRLIIVHSNADYDRFYRFISTMDLIVPGFTDFTYLERKLSSAIPAAVISRVPILGSPMLLEAYAFLRSPAIVLHPAGTSEIEAISLLRQGIDPMTLAPRARPLLPDYSGWDSSSTVDQTAKAWKEYHERIYAANAGMMKVVLADVEQQRIDKGWSVGGRA